MMSHEIIIDVLTICVMTAAVYYAIRLNRSLTRARDGRSELIQLIASLTEAQGRAEAAIQNMKLTAAEYELSLTKQIAVSRGLAEELSMINESSNTLATRLERMAPIARSHIEGGRYADEDAARGGMPTLRAERPFSASQDTRSARPRQIEEKPAQAAPAQTAPARAAPAAVQKTEKPAAAAAPAAAPAKAVARSAEPEPRSRAEKELFAAIETLRKGRPA
jgi:hypothetical protein